MIKLDRAHWSLLAALRQYRTLSAAADAVHITQAAASQRLKEAERRLGISLVERRGKSIRLNASGLRIAETGEQMEQQLRNAETDAIWLGQRTRSRWRLAQDYHDSPELVALISRICASPLLNRDVELIRCGQLIPLQLLTNGEADCAVLPQPTTATDVETALLLADQLVAVIAPDHVLAEKTELVAADFNAYPYLTYNLTPQSGWEYERFFKLQDTHPGNLVKVESTQTILALVSQGFGLSILPQLTCRLAAMRNPVYPFKRIQLATEPITFDWCLQMAATRFSQQERTLLASELKSALERVLDS